MASPLRIAVNARALARSTDPFTRGTSASLLSHLAGEEGVRLDVLTPGEGRAGGNVHRVPSPKSLLGGALFDLVWFPRAARRLNADLLLYLHPSGSMAGPAPVASWYGDGTQGMWAIRPGRLERSLAFAGLRGAAAVLCPSDVPGQPAAWPWMAVPPVVPAELYSGKATTVGGNELPEAYVLAVGESPTTLPLVLASWTWVESSLGDAYIMVLGAHHPAERDRLRRISERMGLSETARVVLLGDDAWPSAFRRASALLHGGARDNAAALRWALAAGLPVAAPATPVSESILGPAGYLAEPTARALGAACLTLLVQEGLAGSLREEAGERGRLYGPSVAGPAWAAALRQVARPR